LFKFGEQSSLGRWGDRGRNFGSKPHRFAGAKHL
jgi:hypothetical protein